MGKKKNTRELKKLKSEAQTGTSALPYFVQVVALLASAFVGLAMFFQHEKAPIPKSLLPIQNLLDGYSHVQNLEDRLDRFSSLFLGRPYLLNPLGEGQEGVYNRKPMFRLDAFDCVTYVETVMALALSHDAIEFENHIKHIRYKNGDVSYTSRNHFAEVDWIPNNIHQNYLIDVTSQAASSTELKTSKTWIDKRGWYSSKKSSDMFRPDQSLELNASLLGALKKEGEKYKPELSILTYIPKDKLNSTIATRIPTGAIISIVRPNWDVREKIGTYLSVSHQGILIKKNGQLVMRHASKMEGEVVEIPIQEYLHMFDRDPTVQGFNLLHLTSPNHSFE